MKVTTTILTVLLFVFTAIVKGAPSPPHRLERRVVAGLTGPTGYTYSWNIDSNRLGIATVAVSSYLTRSTIATTGTVSQASVIACTTSCERTINCAFAHLIQFNNFKEGNNICALYSQQVARQYATSKYGLYGDKSAQVIASYSFARIAGPVVPPATTTPPPSSTTTPTSTPITTPSSTALSTPTYPANTWTWVDVPGTMCADGSQTGFAINPSPGSTELILHYEEGGSCYDYNTCITKNAAYNIQNPFNAATFQSQGQAAYMNRYLMMSRSITTNPFIASNYIYIPYCTGDLHSGNATSTYVSSSGASKTIHHHGYVNGGLITTAVKALLPSINRVWVAGTSAGGFGAILQYQQTQSIFSGVRVDLIADSAETPLSLLVHPSQGIILPDMTLCPKCNTTSFDSLAPGLASANPNSRFALMSFSNDTTIPVNQGVSFPVFDAEIQTLFNQLNAMPNAKTYMLHGSNHGLLDKYTQVGAGGVTMAQWLASMKSDDPKWAAVL